ncbi:uncharacterized protein LOC141901169, partial [Tubulanus polymorphus]|uniref:uncharacterized protein LOC141901169 n=1 Tax=Tubulanus polymorphus TaxID=672921 RepID=UPI003DA577F3
IEVEKYRQLVDNANASLAAGNFTSADEYLVKSKAKTIITCFIDSELPPKVQVNIANEVAEAILADYRHSTMDRGLFHDATVNIFTILSYLWSRFLHHRVAQLVGKAEQEHISPHHMDDIPDYFNIDTSHVKKVLVSGDEEGSRFSFSLRYGLRQIISPAVHRAYTPGGGILPDHAGRRASNYARSRQSIISHGRRESFYLDPSQSSASLSQSASSSRRRLSHGTSRLEGRRRGTLKRIDDQETSSTAEDSSDSTVPSSDKTSGGPKMSVLLKLIDGDVVNFGDK